LLECRHRALPGGEAECGPFFGGLKRGEMRKKVRSQLPEGGGQWQSPAGIGLNPHGFLELALS